MNPLVSIVTASYNHADYIGESVESVRKQVYENWELIIVDDCSTDNTLQALEPYQGDERIRVFTSAFNRQYCVRNFAAARARGDYIAFLNSDDVFFPEKIRRQVEYLEREKNCAAVFTHVKRLAGRGATLEKYNLEKFFAVGNLSRHQWLRRFFAAGNCLGISSAMLRRDFFEELGGFNRFLIQLADLDLWIRTCFRAEIHVIPERLTGNRVLGRGRNLSSENPSSSSRSFLEYQQAYDHYFSPSGLEQMPAIFPEFEPTLRGESREWRCYLLCREAAFLPKRHMRFLGFSKLHGLLKDKSVADLLLERNPRLPRTTFLSEGAAGLDAASPGVTWELSVSSGEESASGTKPRAYWTTAAGKNTACLSFPNPGFKAGLSLKMKGILIPVKYRGFKLYCQETGEPVFPGGEKRDAATSPSFRPIRRNGRSLYFSQLDYTAVPGRWIDLEIAYSPARWYLLLRGVKGLLRALGRFLKSRRR